jgi:hypothetical protein
MVDVPSHHEKVVGKDAFLSAPVLYLEGKSYSVRDLIKVSALRLGGVHVGDPETDTEQEARLRALNTVVLGGLPAVFRTVLWFARQTVASLEPLYEQVRARSRRERGHGKRL